MSLTTTPSFLQISFANTEATLSDATTYKNFLRVTPNKLDLNYLWISFLQNYNWTRVGLLFQDASVGASSYAYVRIMLADGIQSFNYVMYYCFSHPITPGVPDQHRPCLHLFLRKPKRPVYMYIHCVYAYTCMYCLNYIWPRLGIVIKTQKSVNKHR